jgi:hypothetical protein
LNGIARRARMTTAQRGGRDGSGDGFGRLGQRLGRQAGQWRRARDSELRRRLQERNPEQFGRERRSAAGHAGAAAAATAAAPRGPTRRSRRITRRAQRSNMFRSRLLMSAHVCRRRLRGRRHDLRPMMSVAFMGDRQRRHGKRRNQNDRGRNARKLLLQAHATALSQAPSLAKQFSLITAAAQSGNFGAQKNSVHKSGVADVIPRREVPSSGMRHPGPISRVKQSGRSCRARVSLSRHPPSGDIRDSNHCEGAGPSGRAETFSVVPALRKPSHRLRQRGRRPTRRSHLSQRLVSLRADVSSGASRVELFLARACHSASNSAARRAH